MVRAIIACNRFGGSIIMTQKPPNAKVFHMPPEVVGLPKELEGTELTVKQKRRDEARRDQLMKLAGSAARLSPADAEQAHAHTRVSNYQLQLDHLIALWTVSAKERGMSKADLRRSIKATGTNLSEAYEDTGDFKAALQTRLIFDPKSSRRKHLTTVLEAVSRPDGDHCECSVEHLTVRKTIRDRAKDRDVALVHCAACGHMNATAKLPSALNALQQSRQVAKEGETDAHVFARIK